MKKNQNCIDCEQSHERIRKAIWFHPENADGICDECYRAYLSWYGNYKKLRA